MEERPTAECAAGMRVLIQQASTIKIRSGTPVRSLALFTFLFAVFTVSPVID